MIRSLHYAANVGLAARQTVAPQDRLRLSAWVRWWHTWTSVSFLAAYRTAAAGAAFLPSDAAALSALLDWHLLKKVLWEIRHEAERRPELLWIALDGLAEMGTGYRSLKKQRPELRSSNFELRTGEMQPLASRTFQKFQV